MTGADVDLVGHRDSDLQLSRPLSTTVNADLKRTITIDY